MGAFFSQFFAYLWAVGYYWIAIMVWVAFMTGDLANWFGFREWLDRVLPRHRRRPIEIALMLGLVFYAGFEAWQDENVARLRSERVAAEKEGARRSAQMLADERWNEIYGPGGYKDQLNQRRLSPLSAAPATSTLTRVMATSTAVLTHIDLGVKSSPGTSLNLITLAANTAVEGRLRVFVEFSFSDGDHPLTTPEKYELADFKEVYRGQRISLVVLRKNVFSDQDGPRYDFRWGSPDLVPANPAFMLDYSINRA